MNLIKFLSFAALYASLSTANACKLQVAELKLTDRLVDPKLMAQRTMTTNASRIADEVMSNGLNERSSDQTSGSQTGRRTK